MQALMSIKPEYVEKIFNETKKYEYRKTKPTYNINKIIIYSTSPIKKVVGEITIKNIIIDTKENIWNKTQKHSGTTKKFYDKYFYDKEIAIAYEIDKIIIYENPKELIDFGIKNAPQSFIYIK